MDKPTPRAANQTQNNLNHRTFRVLLHLFAAMAAVLLSSSVSAQSGLILYEPFNYSNIGGAVNANIPGNWTTNVAAVTNDFNITGGSLSYPGFATGVGNSATNGGVGLGVRRFLGTNVTSGTLYFSALFKVIDGGYGTWTVANMPAQVGAFTTTNNTSFRLQVMVKSNTPSTYVFGVQKGGTGASTVLDTTPYNIGDTVLLVGKYDFTVTPNTATLWINPAATTFGAVSDPATGFITATSGLDFNLTNVIDRFNFRQNTAVTVPAAMHWDELRVGTSWRDVTPAASVTLTNLVRLNDGTFQFGYTGTSGQAVNVYASDDLATWTSIGSPTEVTPGVYQFSDTSASSYTNRFYELRLP